MRIPRRPFQRKYKPTENFQRFGEIMKGINDYKSQVEQARANQPVDFREMFNLSVSTPSHIGAEIAIFESDLSIQRKVDRRIGFPTSKTNHYSILLYFAEREISRIHNEAYGLEHLPLEVAA